MRDLIWDYELSSQQGRPLSVKHGARCAMSKVGDDKKTQRGGI